MKAAVHTSLQMHARSGGNNSSENLSLIFLHVSAATAGGRYLAQFEQGMQKPQVQALVQLPQGVKQQNFGMSLLPNLANFSMSLQTMQSGLYQQQLCSSPKTACKLNATAIYAAS